MNNKSLGIRELINLGYRPIGNKRARKLKKRGEFVYWNVELHTFLWESIIIKNPKEVN